MNTRGLRKERSGVVVNDRMQKTVVVSVERTVMHPRYNRRVPSAQSRQALAREQNLGACQSDGSRGIRGGQRVAGGDEKSWVKVDS